MENKIGYLNYKEDCNKNFFKKFYNIAFYKVEHYTVNNYKSEIFINKDSINKKILKKIVEIKNKNNIKNIVISNKIKINENVQDLSLLNGKFLMKNIIVFVLKYIFSLINKDIRCENLYVLVDNDKNKDIIIDLAHKFKSISIVTDNIKRLRRLDKRLSNDDEIIISISNNYKKALKKASIIVNFDYDVSFFEKFNVNRNSIIINLHSEKIKMKNSYQGIIVENIKIDYEDVSKFLIKNGEDFDKTILYESYILNSNYCKINDMYMEDNCKINSLIGTNGEIAVSEIKNLK